jgi:hypothetical protein
LIVRAQRRVESFIERRYQELRDGEQGIDARLDVAIVPRFPAKPTCPEGQLIELLRTTFLSWRSVGVPRRSGVITQQESAMILRPGSAFSLIEANV